MKHLAVVVDWYGPYTLDEAKLSARLDYESGLYLGIGKLKHQKGAPIIQYVGISKNLARRLQTHKKLPEILRETKIWLGEVATAEVPGKKIKKTVASLDLAEWALAYFLEIPMNEKKRKTAPSRAITLLNRWWNKIDYKTPWVKRPHAAWPDLIDFVSNEYVTKIVWFGGRVKRVPAKAEV